MIPLTSGRIAVPLLLTVQRDITGEDLFRLETEPTIRTAAPVLQRLKAVHHLAARLMAAGKSTIEIGMACNRTSQRIRDLQKDPAFMELVGFYSSMATDEYLEDTNRINKKLTLVGEMAADELLRRVEDEETLAALPTGELRQILATTLDRSSNPPKSAQPVMLPPQTITFNISGSPKPQGQPAPALQTIDHTVLVPAQKVTDVEEP